MKKTSLKFFTVLLIGMMFMQTNYLLVYYGLFQLNRDALADEVCEEVVVDCNACCYLNKQMNEEEQNANSSAEPVRKNVTRDKINLSDYLLTQIDLACASGLDHLKYSQFSSTLYQSLYLNSIDHPPRV